MSLSKWSLGIIMFAVAAYATVVSAQSLSRGAFVLVKHDQSRLFVKVLAAVPGDTVSIVDARLVVNGTRGDHVIIETPDWGPRRLGPSEFFVVGDPLSLNGDATAWGIVSGERVIGTVQPRP